MIRGRHIFLTATCLAALIIVVAGSWWGYRRYLSPGIEPSVILYPKRGIDLSAHNGKVDFEAVKSSGISFVMLKATEGVSFNDRMFRDNYNAARQAGLKVGAYHFFRFDCNGRIQANHFLNIVRDLEFDFPLALDIEEWGNPSGHKDNDIVESLSAAITHLELNGRQVMLYTNKKGYRKFISTDFPDYPLWICSFSDPPGPDNWYMWQYTHRGHIEGVEGHVDINILR
ncbi:MAG: hypothetical protein NC082_03575 [Clostridiales bacterium]|nr:hypothetical protein [Clostridiales bacterium]